MEFHFDGEKEPALAREAEKPSSLRGAGLFNSLELPEVNAAELGWAFLLPHISVAMCWSSPSEQEGHVPAYAFKLGTGLSRSLWPTG